MEDIQGRFEHYVWLDSTLDKPQQMRLLALLTYGEGLGAPVEDKHTMILRVVPRLGTISPWASKATDIAHNCGLAQVRRIERGVRYAVKPKRGLLGAQTVTPEQQSLIAACLHDRMTETVVDANFDGTPLFESLP